MRKQLFEPYKDVTIFFVTMIVANYAWKWTFTGDESGEAVLWLGLNVTAPFDVMARHFASVVYRLVSLVRDTASMVGNYTIRFESGVSTKVVWGCTGLKQSFIWLCIMLTVPATAPAYKTWLHKLWYIPLGWVCAYLFNILRITLIALFIEYHPEWFDFLHDIFFKYLFYLMFFGLWALFVGKIRPRS